jgi:imidazolonepropionase-like amidohydrolase
VGPAYLAARLFDGRRFVERAALHVEGDTVRYAGAASGLKIRGPRVDLGNVTLCPGFIDLHAHFIGARAYSMTAIASEDERAGALRNVPRALELLRAGFTAARDCGSGPGPFLRDAIEEGSVQGPRLACARAILSQTGGHGDVHSMPAEWLRRSSVFRLTDGPDDARKAVREQFRAGADFIKFCATGGVLSERDHSHQEQFTDEEVRALVDEAHRLGMRTAAHAQGTAGVKRALRAGVDTIEHGFYLDAEAIDLFLARDATLVPTFSIVHQICEHGAAFGVPQGSIDKAKRARDAHVRSFQAALKAGVRAATGTDFMGGDHNRFADAAMEIELMVRAGATPLQALQAATSNAARAITRRGLPIYDQLGPRWFDRVGTLEPGALADVVALQGDPRRNIGAVRRVAGVLKGGRPMVGMNSS